MRRIGPRFATLLMTCAVLGAWKPPAVAQGSAGGSIGKQDKAISGDQAPAGERSSHSHKRAAREERSTSTGRHHGGSRSGGIFDGVWSSVAVGCGGSSRGTATVSGGRIHGENTSGSISSGGALHGVTTANGLTSTFSGHVSGRHGSGTFHRSDGCSGRWTSVKL